MRAVRQESLELPAFDGSDFLYAGKGELESIPGATTSTVLRHCSVSYPSSAPVPSIHDIVSTADREYLKLQEDYGLSVVEHAWGLYPLEAVTDPHKYHRLMNADMDAYPGDYPPSTFIPDGWLLAASVAVIDDCDQEPPEGSSRLKRQLGVYSVRYEQGMYLWDLNAHQFIFGQARSENAIEPAFVLVDIEPRLKLRPKPHRG